MNDEELEIEHVALDAVARHLNRLTPEDRVGDLEYLRSKLGFCVLCGCDYVDDGRDCLCDHES